MTGNLSSRELKDTCCIWYSLLNTQTKSMHSAPGWNYAAWGYHSNIGSQNGIAFPFLILVLMCLSSFSAWPTRVIIVSHHNIGLSSLRCSSPAQNTQIKKRLITIKPGVNIMPLCLRPLWAHPFSPHRWNYMRRIMTDITLYHVWCGCFFRFSDWQACGKRGKHSAHMVKLTHSKTMSWQSPCYCN